MASKQDCNEGSRGEKSGKRLMLKKKEEKTEMLAKAMGSEVRKKWKKAKMAEHRIESSGHGPNIRQRTPFLSRSKNFKSPHCLDWGKFCYVVLYTTPKLSPLSFFSK